MKKSVLIFFAVIAAASALRLPVKAALGKLHVIPLKDAGYEVVREEDTPYETVAMKDVYEHEAMNDEVEADAEDAYESNSMADEESDNDQDYESEEMADSVPESKDTADTPFETVGMKETYEHEAVPEIVYEKKADGPPRVAPLHVPQSPVIGKLHNIFDSKAAIAPQAPQEDEVQTYESGQMADIVYETKHMGDTSYEAVAMKDEYEVEAMADEAEGAAVEKENETAAADMISAMKKFFAENRLKLRSRFQD